MKTIKRDLQVDEPPSSVLRTLPGELTEPLPGYGYYSVKITQTDEYCLSVQHLPPDQCTKTTYVK